jgi:hypothetical protein
MSQFSFPKPKSTQIDCYNTRFGEETLGTFLLSNLVALQIYEGFWSRRFADKLLVSTLDKLIFQFIETHSCLGV